MSASERREHRAHDRAGLHGAAHAAGAEKKDWNKPRGEVPEAGPLDPRDPAYDSEGEEGVRLRRVADDPLAGFKRAVLDIVKEYLTSESIEEAVRGLQALREDAWLYEAVKQMVLYGLEQRERERELLSRLLAALSAGVVHADDAQRGFALVLARLPDAVLDNPGAEVVVGKFLARAVHDECLAPAFLARAAADSTPAKAALAEARVLLEGPGAGPRLEHVWGDAARVTHSGKRLRGQFRALLLEYLANADVADAERALRDLHVPGVLFAFVHEALVVGLQRSGPERAQLSALLAALAKSGLLSEGALVAGVRSCVKGVVDLSKDVTPHARDLLCSQVAAGVAAGYLPAALADTVSADTQRLLDADRAGGHSADAALNSVRALTGELQAALAAGDAARVGALFAPDAVLLPAGHKGAAVVGRAAIAAHLKGVATGAARVTVEAASALSGALVAHGAVELPAAGAHVTMWLPSRSSWTIGKMIYNQ